MVSCWHPLLLLINTGIYSGTCNNVFFILSQRILNVKAADVKESCIFGKIPGRLFAAIFGMATLFYGQAQRAHYRPEFNDRRITRSTSRKG